MKTNVLYSIILFFIIIGFVIWLIVMQIEEYKLQDDPKLFELKKKISPLLNRENYSGLLTPMNNSNLLDKISLYKGDKSYTINKQKIFLCLKDENGSYYDDMMLMYVLLHELSHVICDEVGHTQKFHEIFDQVLEEAHIIGIYDKSYSIIQDYCQYEK